MDEVINQTSMWVVRSSHWPGLSSLGHCRTNPHNQARSKSWSKASRARSGCRMVRSSFLKLLWGYKISINGQDMGWSPGKKLRADGENECASWQLVELWHNPLLQHHDCQRDNRPPIEALIVKMALVLTYTNAHVSTRNSMALFSS